MEKLNMIYNILSKTNKNNPTNCTCITMLLLLRKCKNNTIPDRFFGLIKKVKAQYDSLKNFDYRWLICMTYSSS